MASQNIHEARLQKIREIILEKGVSFDAISSEMPDLEKTDLKGLVLHSLTKAEKEGSQKDALEIYNKQLSHIKAHASELDLEDLAFEIGLAMGLMFRV